MLVKQDAEVLVVGAGPVGLLGALTLAKQGVHVQIVDSDWRTGVHSYALALHPGTLEILAELGLAERVLEKARRIETVALYDGRECRKELKVGEGSARYPYLAVMPQEWLESCLEMALADLGIPVLWNHEATELAEHEGRVGVRINRLEKQSVGYAVAHTEWVVAETAEVSVPLVLGADGHRSTVRRSLGIEFPEVGAAQNFAVFEFRSETEIADKMQLVLADHLTSALWPLPGEACRWSFQLGDRVPLAASTRQKRRVTVDVGDAAFPALEASRLDTLIAQRAPWFGARVGEMRWQIAVRFERRLASRFGKGRLWLVGDAGHMTGPIGVQSMNVGLREVYDLAHVFEGILDGGISVEQLERYNRKRTDEWRGLLGMAGGLQPTDSVDPWLRAHGEDLMSALPGSGNDLKALAAQLGFTV